MSGGPGAACAPSGARAQRGTGSSVLTSSSNMARMPVQSSPVASARASRPPSTWIRSQLQPVAGMRRASSRVCDGAARALSRAPGRPGAGDARPAVDFPGQLAADPGLLRRFLEQRQRRAAARPAGTAARWDPVPLRRARCPARPSMAPTAYRARSTLRETARGDTVQDGQGLAALGWSMGRPTYSGSVASLRSRASRVSAAQASSRAGPSVRPARPERASRRVRCCPPLSAEVTPAR